MIRLLHDVLDPIATGILLAVCVGIWREVREIKSCRRR